MKTTIKKLGGLLKGLIGPTKTGEVKAVSLSTQRFYEVLESHKPANKRTESKNRALVVAGSFEVEYSEEVNNVLAPFDYEGFLRKEGLAC